MAAGKSLMESRFKIVLLGDKDVGKTSIILRYSLNEFSERTSLVPISEQSKRININGKEVVLELWDTAGQERYKSLDSHFYRDADAAILVYSIVDEESFSSLCDYWLKETIRYIPDEDMIPMLVVGNKKDLSEVESEHVDLVSVSEYTKAYGLPPPIETSAKTGENIQKVFHLLAAELYKRHLHKTSRQNPSDSQCESQTSSCCSNNKERNTKANVPLSVH